MIIRIKKLDQKAKPYTLEKIISEVNIGTLDPQNTYCLYEGIEDWILVSTILPPKKTLTKPLATAFILENTSLGVSEMPRLATPIEKCNLNHRNYNLLKSIPKIIWAIIAVGALCFFWGLYGCINRTPLAILKCGLFSGLAGAYIFSWASSVFICSIKGRRFFAVVGILTLFLALTDKGSLGLLIFLTIVPIISAAIPSKTK
jgi:hypothetical protein